MPLAPMDHLLYEARAGRYAVAAFECWNSANIYGIAMGAKACGKPVIFQASPVEYALMGGPAALRRIVELYVEQTGITAALHLDHGTTLAQVEECLAAGFTSVMLDASHEPFEQNLELTRSAVELAHARQVPVEAELGQVGGCEGELAGEDVPDAHLTDPQEATTFVRETGVDCLAVAIGTVHGDYRGKPNIRLDRLREVAAAVAVPLVLHGGSGTPAPALREAIRLGIAKINICTDIHKAWLAGVAAAQGTRTPSVPGRFYEIAHDMLVAKVVEMIRLFAENER
jgi:fructose-bisphosphate aldolase class II